MTPPLLQKGDSIVIVAPAKGIETEYVDFAVKTIEEKGFKAIVSPNCLGQHHYFSGTVKERFNDFQWAIDHPEAKAILCARGGYGCIQLMDRINWANFHTQPKWLLGFSDVTVFHQYLSSIGISSLHTTMPLNFKENTSASLNSLFQCLEKGKVEYTWKSTFANKKGAGKGLVLGGNLSVLVSLIGTKLAPDYQNKLLFIEDVGEHLYVIDRYFHQLSKAGILDQIQGLIVGGFTGMKDTTPPYGNTLQEIILSHFEYRNTPVAFNFPAGHIDDNNALIFGKEARFVADETQASLIY